MKHSTVEISVKYYRSVSMRNEVDSTRSVIMKPNSCSNGIACIQQASKQQSNPEPSENFAFVRIFSPFLSFFSNLCTTIAKGKQFYHGDDGRLSSKGRNRPSTQHEPETCISMYVSNRLGTPKLINQCPG